MWLLKPLKGKGQEEGELDQLLCDGEALRGRTFLSKKGG